MFKINQFELVVGRNGIFTCELLCKEVVSLRIPLLTTNKNVD